MHVHTHYGVGPHPFSIPKKPSSACADKEILTSGGLNLNLFTFSSVQFIHSVVSDSLQPHGLQLARLPCASPTSLSILFKLMSIKLVMPSNHLILCYPFLLLPSILPRIRVFSNESVLPIRWPKYWSFSFSISPSNEYSGLISFRVDSCCSPRDSQESFPTPQFKSISSLVLNFPYSSMLTSTLEKP